MQLKLGSGQGTRVILLRHGQSTFNALELYQGCSDESVLTEVGGKDARIFYMLRWSDAWTLASLQRIREKWNLSEDGYFQTKYKKLGVRRVATIIKPFVRQVSFGNENKPLKRLLKKLDRKLNSFLTNRYTKMLPQRKIELPAIKKEPVPL